MLRSFQHVFHVKAQKLSGKIFMFIPFLFFTSSLLQCVKSVKARKISGKILLEGERLIEDAFKAGVPAEALFFSNPELLKCLPLKNQPLTELYKLSYDKIQLWSDLTTSPGIMGIHIL